MLSGNFADAGPDGGKAVATSRREIAKQAEFLPKRRFGGENFGWQGVGIGGAEEMDQTFDQGRVGIAAEVERSIGAEFADHPHGRLAAGDAMGVDFFFR